MPRPAKNTTALHKRSNNRLYGLGTADKGFSFSALGFRNGIPMLEGGIAILLFLIWTQIFSLIGLHNNSFGGIGAVLNYGPPIAAVWYFTRNDKDTEVTPLETLTYKIRKNFLEPDYYVANEEADIPHLMVLTTSVYTPNPYTKKEENK